MEYFYDIWLISVETVGGEVFLRFSQEVRLSRDFLTNRNKKQDYDSGLSIKYAHKV